MASSIELSCDRRRCRKLRASPSRVVDQVDPQRDRPRAVERHFAAPRTRLEFGRSVGSALPALAERPRARTSPVWSNAACLDERPFAARQLWSAYHEPIDGIRSYIAIVNGAERRGSAAIRICPLRWLRNFSTVLQALGVGLRSKNLTDDACDLSCSRQ